MGIVEFKSKEEAIEKLKLSRRVKWKIYLGYLCRYTKRSVCPEFVYVAGTPVEITPPLYTGETKTINV